MVAERARLGAEADIAPRVWIALALALGGCRVCKQTEPMHVVHALDAATMDRVLLEKRRDDRRCELACALGLQAEQGSDHAPLTLTECQLDLDPDYVGPDTGGSEPGRSELPGGRVRCAGTALVIAEECF